MDAICTVLIIHSLMIILCENPDFRKINVVAPKSAVTLWAEIKSESYIHDDHVRSRPPSLQRSTQCGNIHIISPPVLHSYMAAL